MLTFLPSRFEPHRLFRGGHLQTLVPAKNPATHPAKHSATHRATRKHPVSLQNTTSFTVSVSLGDQVVLHHDPAFNPTAARSSVLLIHGLTGCHAASYMIRLADRLVRENHSVYRMDMRGFGSAKELSKNLSHAGRSDDVIAAISSIAERSPNDRLSAIGISLGAAQLLRATGRIDGGHDLTPDWYSRFAAAVAISPPIDLLRCSDNMNRPAMKLYNAYFIRSLINRAPTQVADREDFQAQLALGRPKTLRQLDDQITAPLSGFTDAAEYYQFASTKPLMPQLKTQTAILAAKDDPIVPPDCFDLGDQSYGASVSLVTPQTGGHVGFLQRDRSSWIDNFVSSYLEYGLASLG